MMIMTIMTMVVMMMTATATATVMATAATERVSPTRRLLSDCDCGRRTTVPQTARTLWNPGGGGGVVADVAKFIELSAGANDRHGGFRTRRCGLLELPVVGGSYNVRVTRFFFLYIYYYYFIYFFYYSLPAKPPGNRLAATSPPRKLVGASPLLLFFFCFSSLFLLDRALRPSTRLPTMFDRFIQQHNAFAAERRRRAYIFYCILRIIRAKTSCPLGVGFFFPYFFSRPSRRMAFVSVCVRTYVHRILWTRRDVIFWFFYFFLFALCSRYKRRI